jgi:hypothetical protein
MRRGCIGSAKFEPGRPFVIQAHLPALFARLGVNLRPGGFLVVVIGQRRV